VSRCHEDKGGTGFSFSQALWVRQGERSPVKVAELALGDPAIGGLCRLFGQYRDGRNSALVGAFQRLSVTPDGALVLFEVTDDFSVNTHVIPEELQGIFAVRADGTAVRKVAEHSRDPSFRVYWPCVFTPDAPGCVRSCVGNLGSGLGFSPDLRRAAYTDLGPSQSGEEAPQVFTLDLSTGERRQVTHLLPLPVSPTCIGQDAECVHPSKVPINNPAFLGATTIAFGRSRGCTLGGVFTVKADGSEEPQAVDTLALGGAIVPLFQITDEPYAAAAVVPGVPENGPSVLSNAITEAFVIEPADKAQRPEGRVLQLTNYRRSDTTQARMSSERERVFFHASANPLGTNPTHQCQWFSIDRLGGELRQLTSFSTVGDRNRTCQDFASPGCTMGGLQVDVITGSLVFGSSCDPLGTNRTGGGQFFAIHPDGSGLRQLTETQGIVENPDRSIDVELPGPLSVSSEPR
jgi:hypothetical protein